MIEVYPQNNIDVIPKASDCLCIESQSMVRIASTKSYCIHILLTTMVDTCTWCIIVTLTPLKTSPEHTQDWVLWDLRVIAKSSSYSKG